MNPELLKTGTRENPGAWWKCGDKFVFTPAPMNSKRFARRTAKSGPVSMTFLIPSRTYGAVVGYRVTATTEIFNELP